MNRIDVSPNETLVLKLKGSAAVEWSLCFDEQSVELEAGSNPPTDEAGPSDFLIVAKDVGYWADGEVRGKWLGKLEGEMAGRVSVKRGVSVVIPSEDVGRLKVVLGSLEASLDGENVVEAIVVFHNLDQVGELRKVGGDVGVLMGVSFSVRVYVWDKPFSYSSVCNYGASKSLAPYVLFLNDDCLPCKGFLSAMLETMGCDPLVGVVGAKLLFPNGIVQHLGVGFRGPEGGGFCDVFPFAGKKEEEVPQAQEDRIVPAVTGTCMLVHREVFEKLGGFDEKEYEFSCYDDFDLCLRAKRDLGLKTVCSGRAVAEHEVAAFMNGKAEGYYQANQIKFKARWDLVLEDTSYVFESDRFRHREERAVILNSYLDTAGGGERTCCALARVLSQRYRVLLVTKGKKIEEERLALKEKLGAVLGYDLFGVDMGNLELVEKPEVFINHEWSSSERGRGKRNIYFTMFPQTGGIEFLDSYDVVVANSKFTAGWVKELWGRKAQVIYPPVRLVSPGPAKKENIILSVGRFFEGVGSKRQDVLLDVWKEVGQELHGWKLVLVGSYREDQENERRYVSMLQRRVLEEQVESVSFALNISRERVEQWYRRAKIFWHAAGYEAECPDGMEHFGIVTAEALSASVYPIVYEGGGQPEILDDVGMGHTWTTKEELASFTLGVVKDEKWNFDCRARVDELYGEKRFEEQVWELLEEI